MKGIDNIEIKNFKSIRHQKIEGCRRINVFIGYPNVGKSNILEALSLGSLELNNAGRPIILKDLYRFEEIIGLFNDGNKHNKIEVNIDAVTYTMEYVDQQTINYEVIERSNQVDNKIGNSKISSTRLTINGTGILNHQITEMDTEKPNFEIKKYQFKGLQNHVRNNPLILDFPSGDNLFEVLRYNADIRKQSGELFSDFELKLAFDEDSKLKIQKQLDEYSIFQIPMLQISETLQRLIFYKAALATNKNSVLLLEEPEAHMFPPYIRKLTTDILLDKSNQFFLTTHSPYVLDELILDSGDDLSVYLVDYKNGETIIHYLSQEVLTEVREYGVDLFFNIESYLNHGQVNNS